LVLGQTLRIDSINLQFAPLGAVLRIAALFVLSRRLLRSSLVGAVISATAAFDYSFGISVNTIFTHAFGFALYFLFLLGYLMLLQKKSLTTYVMLTIIFTGAYFYSYVAAVWIIALLGFILVMDAAKRKRGRQSDEAARPVIRPSLFLAFLVAFVAFNQILYKAYFINFLQRDYSLVLFRFLGGLIGPSQSVAIYRPPIPWPLTVLNVIYTASLLAVPTIFILELAKRRSSGTTFPLMTGRIRSLFVAMVLTMVLDSSLYFIYGYLDLKYVSIVFPLLSVGILAYAFVGKIRNKTDGQGPKLSHRRKFGHGGRNIVLPIFLVLLLMMNLGRFGIAIESDGFSRFSNTGATAASGWLFAHYQGRPAILSDMSTLGKFDMYAAGENRTIDERFYDPFWFQYLVVRGTARTTHISGYADFVVIDARAFTQGTDTQLWSVLPPLAPQLENISAHTDLNLVYADGQLVVYSTIPVP